MSFISSSLASVRGIVDNNQAASCVALGALVGGVILGVMYLRSGGDDAATSAGAAGTGVARVVVPPPMAILDPTSVRIETLKRDFPDSSFVKSGDLVVINDFVSVSPAFIDHMGADDFYKLVMATQDPAADGAQNILDGFAKSGSYRMRYTSHEREAWEFVQDLAGKVSPELVRDVGAILDIATPAELRRAFDLKNEGSPPKNTKGLNEVALDFAMRCGSRNLPELVENYQFFKAVVMSHGRAERGAFWTRIAGAGALSPEGFAEINALREDHVAASHAEGVGRRTPTPDGPKAKADLLEFGSASALSYHVVKHFQELPGEFRRGDTTARGKTSEYVRCARETVLHGAEVKTPGQFGGESGHYVHEFVDPPSSTSMRCIVRIMDDGSIIATLMSGK